MFRNKKNKLCRCGCKTWCSLHEISSWLHWAFAALSTGTWPSDRHDSRAWGDSDAGRQICAGQRLGFKAAVVFIKADWAEYVSTFGFPAWNSVEMDPCHICPAPLPEFYSLDWLTPLGMRHPSKTLQSYLDACDRCEIRVALNRDQHVAIRGALWWDKRKDTGASHGRGLRHDIPPLGLFKNDRPEPWEGMLDVGEFDSRDAFPRTVLFWRSSQQTSTKHRNPIFSATTGIEPNTSLSVCWLHTLSLGPLQVYSVHLVHRLVAANA